MKLILILSFLHSSFSLIQNDWGKLESKVTLRYFSPTDFSPSQVKFSKLKLPHKNEFIFQNPAEIWNKMGHNIGCKIQESSHIFGLDPTITCKQIMMIIIIIRTQKLLWLCLKILMLIFHSRFLHMDFLTQPTMTRPDLLMVRKVFLSASVCLFTPFPLYFSLDDKIQQRSQCHLSWLARASLSKCSKYKICEIKFLLGYYTVLVWQFEQLCVWFCCKKLYWCWRISWSLFGWV